MKFGIAIRRQLTGGELAVRIYQIASLLTKSKMSNPSRN